MEAPKVKSLKRRLSGAKQWLHLPRLRPLRAGRPLSAMTQTVAEMTPQNRVETLQPHTHTHAASDTTGLTHALLFKPVATATISSHADLQVQGGLEK